jgi:cytochrome c oxidase subunit 2
VQIPSAILTLVLGMALVLGGLWVGQTINLLPIDASVNAPIYDELFKVLFTIGIILFVGIAGLLIFSLIHFRRRSGEIGMALPLKATSLLKFFGRPSLPSWCCL